MHRNMKDEVIKIEGLSKSFGANKVLDHFNLTLHRGENLVVLGKSGSGKSTLLHIIGTLDSADSGNLNIVGQPIANLSAKQLAAFRNQHIGFVFQFHHLLPEFTALENVCIPGFIRQEPRQSVEKRAKELLDYLGLTNRLSHKPTELSGGEQQRVAVARALINQPNIIFADEPTGNLDSSASKDFHLLIRQLCDDKKQTFVIVTHNQELADLSDRCLTMQDGILINSTSGSRSAQTE